MSLLGHVRPRFCSAGQACRAATDSALPVTVAQGSKGKVAVSGSRPGLVTTRLKGISGQGLVQFPHWSITLTANGGNSAQQGTQAVGHDGFVCS